jgi:hypothetical protein
MVRVMPHKKAAGFTGSLNGGALAPPFSLSKKSSLTA